MRPLQAAAASDLNSTPDCGGAPATSAGALRGVRLVVLDEDGERFAGYRLDGDVQLHGWLSWALSGVLDALAEDER